MAGRGDRLNRGPKIKMWQIVLIFLVLLVLGIRVGIYLTIHN